MHSLVAGIFIAMKSFEESLVLAAVFWSHQGRDEWQIDGRLSSNQVLHMIL